MELYKKAETSFDVRLKEQTSTKNFFYQTNAGDVGNTPEVVADNLELQACQLPILNHKDKRMETIRLNQEMRKHDRSTEIKKERVPSHWINKIEKKWVSRNVKKEELNQQQLLLPKKVDTIDKPEMTEAKKMEIKLRKETKQSKPMTPFDLSDLKPWAIEKDLKDYIFA